MAIFLTCITYATIMTVFSGSTEGYEWSDVVDLFMCNTGRSGAVSRSAGCKAISSIVEMDVNKGCRFTGCTMKNGSVGITLANITVFDSPTQKQEYHWMWSVIGHPAIQTAITSPGDLLTVDWDAIFGFRSVSKAIKYGEPPVYSSAIMMTKLIEYDDIENTGKIPENDELIRVYDLPNFDWKYLLLENSTRRVAIEVIGQNFSHDYQSVDGKLNLTLSGYAANGFGKWFPHLSHSRETNQFDVQLQDLKTNSEFNNSRYAVELVLVSSDQDDDAGLELRWQNTTTLDDEHTPGIFTTRELIVPGVNETLQSYIQWRPIVYTTIQRELSASTGVNLSEPVKVRSAGTVLNNTLLYAIYGPDLDRMVVRAINVSFGGKGDGFYKKTNYQSWTFTFGTGSPIRNGFSGMVILAIATLFTVAFLALTISSIIFVVKKGKMRREIEYRQIDNSAQ